MRLKPKEWAEYIFFQSFFILVKIIPAPLSRWVGKKIGSLAYHVMASRRQLTIENINEAIRRGFLSSATDAPALAKQAWENLGLNGRDFLYYYELSPKRIKSMVRIEGEANLKKLLDQKKGVVMVMGHIGNWELLGIYLSIIGYPLSPIVQTQSNSLLDKLVEEKRSSVGMKTIPKMSFLRPIVEAFKRNEVVPFLIDQNAGEEAIPVNFFGRKAYFPPGPAEFSLRRDVPVVFAYIVREAPERHVIVISEEINLKKSGNYEQDLKDNIQDLSGMIQEIVKKYPAQWLWMHKLWPSEIKV